MAHAILGASSSKRWMDCTPSARLELTVKTPEPESGHAMEGTVAHDLFEQLLGYQLGQIDAGTYEQECARIQTICLEKGYDFGEMINHIRTSTTYVRNYVLDGDTVLLEKRVDFSKWVPEGFGTADVIIYGNGRIHVMDLKYGAGIKVFATNNSQARLYALGTLNTFGAQADKVISTILQPRMNHFDNEEISSADLLSWAENEVAPKAAAAWNGAGDFSPSIDNCRFCKAKAICNARAKQDVREAIIDFAPKKAPAAMTDDEVATLLEKAEAFVSWINDAKDYLTKRAIAGNVPTGYTLKRYSKARVWTDKAAVLAKLRDLAVPEDRIFSAPALKSPTQLETILKKDFFSVHLGALTEKQYGEPKLVKGEDSDGGAQDFA